VSRFERGVTLLELMAVVVIIGILASVAIPSYRTYVMRAQRADATAAVLRVAAAQEKFYLQNNSYTTTLTGTSGLNLGSANSERGYYQLSVVAGSTGNIATSYLATATALAGQPQIKDTDCRTFTVNETGQRGATKAASGDSTATCWR
jgi:type IV pilus assembly protein PilE